MARFARRRLRAAFIAAMLLCVFVALGLWARDAALVRVEHVTVIGARGPQASAVREALTATAQGMTTLHVRDAALTQAVRSYPIVHSISTTADFPHTLRITVNSYEPVAALQASGRPIAIAPDGTLLRGISSDGLPVIALRTMPAGTHLRDLRAAGAVRFVAAAPAVLLARVERMVTYGPNLIGLLRDGPKLYFGDARRPEAKWAAAARVLADRAGRGADYVDLRLPERPAAGGLPSTPALNSTSTSG